MKLALIIVLLVPLLAQTQRDTIRGSDHRIIGYLVTASTGDQKLYNHNNRLLGYYRRAPNMTYDANYRQVGRGNQLMRLLR